MKEERGKEKGGREAKGGEQKGSHHHVSTTPLAGAMVADSRT